jgi:hypothetical protein
MKFTLGVHGRGARPVDVFKLLGRIVVQDPLAALANQHLLTALDVLKILEP